MKKILVVEDDAAVCSEIVNLLSNSGFLAVALNDYNNALSKILDENADLILLDINLPYVNGQTLLKKIREKSDIPIIMVTSENSENSEILSMSFGADDYITKPFNANILVLRINNLLKRCNNNSEILVYKDISFDNKKGILSSDKAKITLTKNEMIILNLLLENKEKIVTRDELMILLWDNNEFINDNALTVNISRLRTKIKEITKKVLIETKKGLGYILL